LGCVNIQCSGGFGITSDEVGAMLGSLGFSGVSFLALDEAVRR
jgi:hypothetical protein